MTDKFTRLEELLRAQKWKKADLETQQLLLSITGREQEKWLRDVDVDDYELPPDDLAAIDNLWFDHSDGRFGFSVQKKFYLETKCTAEFSSWKWVDFCHKVGWLSSALLGGYINSSNAKYDISAPKGHLPWVWLERNLWHCNEQTRTAYPVLILREDLKVRQ